MLGKTFDEDGYVSFLLKTAEDFKNTYFRSIIEANPEVYFTNNVVNSTEVALMDWINKPDNVPEQIYVDQMQERTDGSNASMEAFDPTIKEEKELLFTKTDNLYSIETTLTGAGQETGRIRIYLQNAQDFVPVQVNFTDDAGGIQQFQGNFAVRAGNYAEIYLPKVNTSYTHIEIITDTLLSSIHWVVTERMTKDAYVDVQSISFNGMAMDVNAPTEGYVTILQTKHKGWQAYVDGKKTEITLVNGNFMGIHVEEGQHRLILKFRPMDFFVGASLTGLYFLTLLVVMIIHCIKKKRKSSC